MIAAAASLAGCFRPPEDVLVDGPTLSVEIATISEADVAGSELLVVTPLVDPARNAHNEFIAANAGTINAEHPVGLQGARVRLRAGSGVDQLVGAFRGLMIFVAPEDDPTMRRALASAVTATRGDVLEMELIANTSLYEESQSILTASRFFVGVSGPTPLGAETAVEFGLTIELDLAIYSTAPPGGHL